MASLSYPNHSFSELISSTSRNQPSMARRQDTGSTTKSRASRALRAAIVLFGLLFSTLDTSIVATGLVNISTDLNNDYLNSPWVVLSYLLTYMALSVGFSKLSDTFGRRNMIVVAWMFFSGFSIACALANTMEHLIIARAFQGIGGAGLYSLAQVCLVEIGPSRPEIVGALIGITLSISYVLGPLLGGAISSYWSWRGIFFINIPSGVLAIGLIFLMWPSEQTRFSMSMRTGTPIPKIDILGISLLTAASALLVFGMQEGGALVWSWDHPVIVWSLASSGICVVVFSIWEAFIGTRNIWNFEPVCPIRLAGSRVYMFGLLTTFFTGWSYISLVIDIPERLQIITGDSALWAGVHLLPMLCACALGSFIAGAVSKSKNNTSQTLIFGCGFQFMGTSLLYGSAPAATDFRPILAFTAVFGFGVGLCFAAATMLTTVEAKNSDLAVAQGAMAQARVLGGCIGLSVCTIVFNAFVESDLSSSLSTSVVTALHRTPLAMLDLSPELQLVIKAVYIEAFRNQMLSMMAASGLALMFSFGTIDGNAPGVVDTMSQHKNTPSARASDTELDDLAINNQSSNPTERPLPSIQIDDQESRHQSFMRDVHPLQSQPPQYHSSSPSLQLSFPSTSSRPLCPEA